MIDLVKRIKDLLTRVGRMDSTAPQMDTAPADTDNVIQHLKAIRETVGQEPVDDDSSLHTIMGQPDDAIPAMDAAPGNDSVVEHLKAILERVGATPADPDESLHTAVGQTDASALITGSANAKLAAAIAALGVVAAAGTGFEADGSGATLYKTLIAVEGATTGAGTTATFVDAARTEGADYWNGNLIVALAGDAEGQVRTIVDDNGAGTLTVEPVLIAAPGTPVVYVILNQKCSDWIVGANNTDNAYDSNDVFSNRWGSILERLENLGLTAASVSDFTEDWSTETIEADIWTSTDPGTNPNTIAYDPTFGNPAFFIDIEANETARLVSNQKFEIVAFRDDKQNVAQQLVLEFEMGVSTQAALDNTLCFWGFTSAVGDDRTSNDLIGFCMSGGNLYSLIDNAGAEQTDLVAATMGTRIHYMIILTEDEYTFYAGHTAQQRYTSTQLGHMSGFLNFYFDTVAAATDIYIGRIRVYYNGQLQHLDSI